MTRPIRIAARFLALLALLGASTLVFESSAPEGGPYGSALLTPLVPGAYAQTTCEQKICGRKGPGHQNPICRKVTRLKNCVLNGQDCATLDC